MNTRDDGISVDTARSAEFDREIGSITYGGATAGDDAGLRAAARALLDKLDAVDAAGLVGIFQMAAIHGAPWTGPNYTEERRKLEEVLGRKAGA